ncbi:NAD(P)HX epimerase / NAD(P)HX dehydratase [hydrothermal vent metagenome]|uniref:Nicotinamide nucleotide repair protein n=1 Tax=hydrothermal vent metagenome TaxID=652676 RepID=A0A1W1E9V2_9ZZZZ
MQERMMQKVFQSCDVLDRHCYEAYGLTEDILMEHAAAGMAHYIRSHFSEGSRVLIVSGPGNNGADGIVLARQLFGMYDIQLCVPLGMRSEMATLQLERAQKVGIMPFEAAKTIEDADVVVDALFGAGLNRMLNDTVQQLLHRLNALKGFKLACDIPTGIGSDGRLMPFAFEADVTVTMGALKEALFLDAAKDAVGKVVCVDLGVSRQKYEHKSNTFVLESRDLRLPTRHSKTTHKGSFGHAALLCGEKEGAGIIAATAASRFGAGLTTLVVHEKVAVPLYLMHATVVPANATALAAGMGLGGHFDADFLQKHIIQSHLPIVLDADAFYHEGLLSILEQKTREIVITPHPKEFAALWEHIGKEQLSVEEIQQSRFEVVRCFNARYPHVTLLLKGANMLIAQEEQLYINPLGSAVLSKGGSGDVLSGLIVSLLAQGYTGLEAAIQGSLALAVAAERYEGASYAMLPTDLTELLAKLE